MTPGQRWYIENRIFELSQRAAWLRMAIAGKQPWVNDRHHNELAKHETKIAALRARMAG